jgi:hypothetical protein
VGGLIILADYYAVAPRGSDALKILLVFVVFPFLLSVAVIPIALFCCILPRLRRTAFQVLLSCLIFAVILLTSIRIGGRVRINGFHALARRSVPLVEAIKAYEQANGHPPETLAALVPEFLPSIPQTGMAAYPEYRYHVGAEGLYEGNPWILEVSTPSGILNFDRFLYYPMQNYGPWCGDPLERVGDWAYHHE